MEENMSVGEKIKQLMETCNLTQKELADKCDLTEGAISKYVNGERTPRVEVLIKMTKKLEISPDYFMDDKLTEFVKIKSLVARNAGNLTDKEKMELMQILMDSRKKK